MPLTKAMEVFHAVENIYGCKVIHAAVMGSRNWGFQSPDSDYDVHFIYVFPENRYMQLDNVPADNIVLKIDATTELHGYELKNYLKLIRKSNTFPSELLWSNGIMGHDDWVEELRKISKEYFNIVPHWNNHRGIAVNELTKVVDSQYTSIKPLLYAARSLLSCMLMEQKPGIRQLPLKLEHLLSQVANIPDGVYSHIKYLMKLRVQGSETAMITPQIVNNMKFLWAELKFPAPPLVNASIDPRSLDKFLQDTLKRLYFPMPEYDNRLFPVSPLELVKHDLGLRDDPTPRHERNVK